MSSYEIALRLGLSFVFGCLIGIERQWHHKNAGLKTNTFVSVGACAFSLIAGYGFGPGTGLAQVAGGVVTGIGFIGGGVILRHGGSVQGINSAATLWATASVGLALGLGNFRVAIFVFGFVLIVQFMLRPAALYIDKLSGLRNQITPWSLQVVSSPDSIEQVRRVWAEFAERPDVSMIVCREQVIDDAQTKLEVSFNYCGPAGKDITNLGQSFSRIMGVIQSEYLQKPPTEGE